MNLKRRKMAAIESAWTMMRSIIIKIFLVIIFLNVVTSRSTTKNNVDIIQINLGHRYQIKEKVPAYSKVVIKCSFVNPVLFKHGENNTLDKLRTRSIRFENIKRTDSGVYSCKSEDNQWSNLTLTVLPFGDIKLNFADNIEVYSQITENDDELATNNEDSDDYFEKEMEKNSELDQDDTIDPQPEDETVRKQTEGSLPVFKHKNLLLRTLPKPSGSYIKLPCAASGNPMPNITWTKEGGPIIRTMGKVQYKKWAMSMEDAIPEDSGLYKCEVCNIYGCISHTTKLIIQERLRTRPIMKEGYPKNVTALENSTVTFECKMIADLEPFILWTTYSISNESISDLEDSATKFLFKNSNTTFVHKLKSDPENSDILKLENVTHENEGWYTCIAANSLGTSASSAYLRVIDEIIDDSGALTTVPIRNHSVWISIVTVAIGLLFLLGTFFIFYILRKLKHAKLMKHRMETVHQWTKKVIIYKPSTDPESPETMVMPIIKIEKQRTTLLQSSNSDPAPFNEYEFPLDSNWEIPRNQLILGAILGEGAFGRVVMAEAQGLGKNCGGCIVAVKMVKEGHTDTDMAGLVREMEVMKMIGKHINIINLLGCCSQDGPLYVIVEYAPHGNLKDFLKKYRPLSDFEMSNLVEKDRKSLTQKDLISFAFQVARGMEYLASRRCIHRDLAARNVLVSDDYVIKIADFGLARDIQDTDYYRKNTNGRLPIKWMAPESLQEKFYDTQSDVWSYGVLLWEIMTFGEQPYPQIMSAEELYNYLMSGQRMEKPQRCSLNIYMLMRQCWNFDAHARPTFTEIVENLDKILTATSNEEYLDLGMNLLETPPSSDEESDTETLRETSLLRYHY